MERAILRNLRVWLGIAALGWLGLGAHWAFELVEIDSCLDAGYAYNYTEEFCDTESVNHPVIPYHVRHVGVVSLGAAAGIAGLTGAAVSYAGKRRTRAEGIRRS